MDRNYLSPPHPHLVKKVKNRLEELDLFFDDNSVAAIVAALDEYVFDTHEGREYAAQKFKFDWTTGEPDMVYSVVSSNGSTANVKGDDVTFLKSCMIKGDFFPPHQVFEKAREVHDCELCGQSVHCSRLVKDPDYVDKIRVCNHCLIYLPNAAGGEVSGGIEECTSCPKTDCSSNPSQEETNGSGDAMHLR